MDHQSLYYSISVGVNVLLVIATHQMWMRMKRILLENEIMAEYIARINKAFDDDREEVARQRQERMNNPPPLPTQHQMMVDHQTFLLMHLATNNPNEAEAMSAAMHACERIMRPTTKMLVAKS